MRELTAVLFDLDDTLFDHAHCARTALAGVHAGHTCFRGMTFEELEAAHGRFLEELHREVLEGRIDLDAARVERFRRLFAAAGASVEDQLAVEAASTYRERYLGARRAVEGAAELLRAVRPHARVGIVSNNLLDEQQQKLRTCGLEPLVDVLVVSEEVGVSKPDAAIFRAALDRLDCEAQHAVMIGDSWTADVIGARAAGIRAIWFNRRGVEPPERLPGVAEITALHPAETVLQAIYEMARSS